MLAKANIYIYFLFTLFMFSCVEKYSPSLENYEDLLVVDGFFTNEKMSHMIKLFITTNVYSTEYKPVSNAEVRIISQDGDVFEFYEMYSNGEYYSGSNVSGEVGKQYKLQVDINNTIHYETDFQELSFSPAIDSIYCTRESRETWEIGEIVDGLQFFLNTKTTDTESEYFFWQLEETFEYDAELFIDSYYAGGFYDFPDEDRLFTCWKTQLLPDIFTYSITQLENREINNLPLHYVANDSKRLSKRYSLLVKQLSLDERAFNFWNVIKEQNANEGELYSKQPFQVRGNLKNIDNPNEVVLGYFTVAGVSEKRIFVDRPNGMIFPNMKCDPDPDALAYVVFTSPSEWPKYIAVDKGTRGVVSEFCVDCRARGGSIMKPDFWK